MKTYRQNLAGVIKFTSKSSLGIFIVGVFFVFFFNGLAWAFARNSLSYLVPLLSFFYLMAIYIILPFLVTLILVKVLLKYGGGAVLFSIIIMAIQLLIIFFIAIGISEIFFNGEIIWRALKGPTYVIIDLG